MAPPSAAVEAPTARSSDCVGTHRGGHHATHTRSADGTHRSEAMPAMYCTPCTQSHEASGGKPASKHTNGHAQTPSEAASQAVYSIVGRHDGPRVGAIDDHLEGAEVKLAQRPCITCTTHSSRSTMAPIWVRVVRVGWARTCLDALVSACVVLDVTGQAERGSRQTLSTSGRAQR